MPSANRRQFVKAAGAGSIVGLAGCLGGVGSSDGDVEMTIASNFVEDHVLVKAAKKFKEDIEAETDGSFTVEISPGGAYGSASEITELTRNGGVDGTVIEVDPTVEFVRLATPAQTGELHLYRRPDHTAVSVVAITHTDIVKLGSLYELTILERPSRAEADSKSNAPILEWRCK